MGAVYIRTWKDVPDFRGSRNTIIRVCCESRGINIRVPYDIQNGSSFSLLQGDGVLRQANTTPDLNEAKGLQEEALEAARFLDPELSFSREMFQLSHQQRVVSTKGAVLLQDLSKVAAGGNKHSIICEGAEPKNPNLWFFYLLEQTQFYRVRVVVQNHFIVTSLRRAVVQVLKISHLLSKVNGYAERLAGVKEWSDDGEHGEHGPLDFQLENTACPWGWQHNSQRVVFKKILVWLLSYA